MCVRYNSKLQDFLISLDKNEDTKFMVEVLEVNAYVLPTIGRYSAYVDVDIDKHSKRYGKKPHRLRINVYSPEELDEGELARISNELKKEWSRYIIEREQARTFYKWFKMLAPIELLLLSGSIITDFLIFTPPTSYLRAGWDIFFWGLILGLTGIIPGIRSFRDKRREDRAKQLLKNWKGTQFAKGTDEEKRRRVNECRNYFSRIDGRKVDIYKRLKNYSLEIGFKPAYDLYEWKIKDLTEEESFFTKYLPASWRRKMKIFLFGVKVESPKVVAPVRSMDVDKGD